MPIKHTIFPFIYGIDFCPHSLSSGNSNQPKRQVFVPYILLLCVQKHFHEKKSFPRQIWQEQNQDWRHLQPALFGVSWHRLHANSIRSECLKHWFSTRTNLAWGKGGVLGTRRRIILTQITSVWTILFAQNLWFWSGLKICWKRHEFGNKISRVSSSREHGHASWRTLLSNNGQFG